MCRQKTGSCNNGSGDEGREWILVQYSGDAESYL